MRAIVYDIKPLGWLACKLLRPVWPEGFSSRLGGLAMRTVPEPPLPGDDWVRVRTRLAGVCGTDLAIFRQKQPPDSILQAFSSLPAVFGHENVGEVVETGPAVDDAWLGRRVCVEPTLCCRPRGIEPPCEPCSRGAFGACENFGAAGEGRYRLPAGTSIGYNAATGGGYGENFVAHESQLVPVPDEMPDEVAVLTDPLACSLHGLLRADLSRVESVLVYGAGVLGLGAIGCLRAMDFRGRIDALGRGGPAERLAARLGADEYFTLPADRDERFRQIARRTGAREHRVRFGNRMLSGGYDMVIDLVGTAGSMEESVKWTAARGQVLAIATGSGGRIDLTPVWFRELTVVGVYGRQIEDFRGRKIGTYQAVHELILEGALDPSGLLTHTFAPDEYREAIRTAGQKRRSGALKVAFDWRDKKEPDNG